MKGRKVEESKSCIKYYGLQKVHPDCPHIILKQKQGKRPLFYTGVETPEKGPPHTALGSVQKAHLGSELKQP